MLAAGVAYHLSLQDITTHHHLTSSSIWSCIYPLRGSRRWVFEVTIANSIGRDIEVGIMAREERLSNKPVRDGAVRAIDLGIVRQSIGASEGCGAIVAAVVKDIPDAFLR